MLIEALRAARNERAQRAPAASKPPGDVYAIMQIAYPGAFLAMLAEGAVRGGAPVAAVAIGATVFALAKALKWWAILALGQAWTFRVIVVPRRRSSSPGRTGSCAIRTTSASSASWSASR